MADMKTELTTRINVVKEDNDQKNKKYINQINKVEEEANKDIKYTRKLIDQLSDKWTRRLTSLIST